MLFEKCCGYFPLKIGVQVYGILYGIFVLIDGIYAGYLLHTISKYDDNEFEGLNKLLIALAMLLVLWTALYITFTVFLVTGAKNGNPKKMNVWIQFERLSIVLTIVRSFRSRDPVTILIAIAVLTPVRLYLWFCVKSLHTSLTTTAPSNPHERLQEET